MDGGKRARAYANRDDHRFARAIASGAERAGSSFHAGATCRRGRRRNAGRQRNSPNESNSDGDAKTNSFPEKKHAEQTAADATRYAEEKSDRENFPDVARHARREIDEFEKTNSRKQTRHRDREWLRRFRQRRKRREQRFEI